MPVGLSICVFGQDAQGSSPEKLAVSLFNPGVTMIVVTVGLPETRMIVFCELNAFNPLGALPEIKPGNDQPYRVTMFGSQYLVVVLDGKEHILLKEVVER